MSWWGCASQSFFCPREGENAPQTPPSSAELPSRGSWRASKRPFEVKEAPSRDPFDSSKTRKRVFDSLSGALEGPFDVGGVGRGPSAVRKKGKKGA